MSTVELNDNEWGQVMSIIGDAPWKQANPLLMKIGEQLRLQQQPNPPTPPVPQEQSKRDNATLDGGGLQ